MAVTSIGSWPTDWQASTRNRASLPATIAPTPATSLTRPLLVGTWVTATRRTRSSMRRSRSGSDNAPVSSLATTSTVTPSRSAACSRAMTLLAYSDEDVRMRSPGRQRIAVNALIQARVALSANAISDASAPTSAASDERTRATASPASCAAS